MSLKPEAEKREQKPTAPKERTSTIVGASVGPLILSILFGIYMLSTDSLLHDFAPAHYYALVGFTVISVIVVALPFVRPKRGLLAAWIWSIIYLILLVGDLTFGASYGILSSDPAAGHQAFFDRYLIGLSTGLFTFDALLVLQIISIFATAAGYSKLLNITPSNIQAKLVT
jgi:hypothetical protein